MRAGSQPAITPRPHPLPPAGDPAFNSAAHARRLLRTACTAALATLDAGSRYPFASSVSLATDMSGAPLMLLSLNALHTRNILHDDRVSVMITPPADGAKGIRPGARPTIAGRALRDDDPAVRRRFLARHPKLTIAAQQPGFAMFRMLPEAVDLLAGERLAPELTAADLLVDPALAPDLAGTEERWVRRLNDGHATLVARLAVLRAGQPEGAWRVTGLDPEGIDLRHGTEVARVRWDAPVTDGEAALAALRAMI